MVIVAVVIAVLSAFHKILITGFNLAASSHPPQPHYLPSSLSD